MYISNYATYIPASSIKKTNIQKENSTPYLTSDVQKNEQSGIKATFKEQVSLFPAYYNFSQEKEKNKNLNRVKQLNKIHNAVGAYKETQETSSSMTKQKVLQPHSYSTQRPTFSQEAKEMQDAFLRVKMINTYIENDNYYRITAA